MQEYILYIAAVIIVVSMLFILFAAQQRAGDASIDATQYQAAKQSIMDLAQVIERDFHNIGSQRHGLYLDPDTAIVAFDTVGTPRVFEFYAQAERGQPARRVRYEWSQSGTVDLTRGTVPRWTLLRHVAGAVDGRSDDITRLRLDLLKADSSGIFNLKDTRQLVVSIRAISPLGIAASVEEASWDKVIRPVNMARNDRAW